MADTDQSNDTAPSRGWLPSPSCLFAVSLLVILAPVCFWMGWRVHRQQARLQYFQELGAFVETEPAKPVWLHDLVVATLGEEHARGFTDITFIILYQTPDTSLQQLNDLTKLESLYLKNTQVTDAGVDELRSQLPGVRIYRWPRN